MHNTMKSKHAILMAQINPTVGAIEQNTTKILEIIHQHQSQHDLIIFPELALTGYPPEDLLLRQEFFAQIETSLLTIAQSTTDCHIILGHPLQMASSTATPNRCSQQIRDNVHGMLPPCYNAASIFHQGQCIQHYFKQCLPNYGVFDEYRYFIPGPAQQCVFEMGQDRFGLCICEDLWQHTPMQQLFDQKVDYIICINASPFTQKKLKRREAVLQQYAKQKTTIIYVNQVGGQDELVFDGQSMVMNPHGEIIARAPAFEESLQTILVGGPQPQPNVISPALTPPAVLYKALCCGLQDYVAKNHFSGVLLGLSGGIDSALALTIAVDALGPEKVFAVMLPSRYTQPMSVEDAQQQINLLNIYSRIISIEPLFQAGLSSLTDPPIEPSDQLACNAVWMENLQARIRGLLLMALSNQRDLLLINTSNKSETAVGYTTLYGDMNGGFSPLKDVLKTQVYALAYYRNEQNIVIPERVLQRPPSAELALNQTDQNTLPDYALLDAIVSLFMEHNLSRQQMIARGFNPLVVDHILTLVKRNEYKRRQAPPGIKVSECAFGKDWRYPLTSGFHN